MKTLHRILPVVVVGSFILMSSQLLSAPQTSPLFAAYGRLDTIAHIILYFGLGFFVCRYLRASVSAHSAVAFALAASVSLTFGVADEFHQMYIPGRSADLGDLLADLIGAMAGAGLYLALAGLSQWTREFLSSAEIPWTRVLLRGVVALGAVVAVCAPAVVYGESIVKVCQALLLEGSVQAQQAVNRHVTPTPLQTIHTSKDMVAPSQPGGTVAKAAPNNPPARLAVLEPTQIPEQLTAVREHPEAKTPERQSVTRKFEGNGATGPELRTTEDLERQLLEEMQRIMVRLSQLERASSVGAAPAAINVGSRKTAGSNGALRERIVQALAAQGIDTGKFTGPAARSRQALGTGNGEPDPCDLVAIITNNSNSVNELTLSQARKIFSGELTNWSQVGGPDLPVKVVTVRKRSGDLEQKLTDHLQAPLSPRALRLPLVSLIIPVVARTEGAIGFVPVLNTEQLDFVAGHTAFKRVAIKSDGQSPAFEPDRMALSTSTYPIMKEVSTHQTLAAGSTAAVSAGAVRR